MAGAVFALLATGCGQLASWDERWMFDTGRHDGSPAPGESAGVACEADEIFGYHYAGSSEFWLGSQAALDVSVSGPGYLVAGAAGASDEALRFARSGELFVASDGTISLGQDEPALGFAPGAVPGGPCPVALRAPVFSPPQATSSVEIGMNLDPRTPITSFDIADPNGTSSSSVSFSVFDSLGAAHILDIYFAYPAPLLVEYHVLADGGDISDQTAGHPVDLSAGTLQFNSLGALDVATTPAVEISFSGGATPNQAISLDFGPDIVNDGSSGVAGSTMFAAPSAVYSLSSDGHPSGTGTDIEVGAAGDVRVRFDNGDALTIGTLALARFPREAALAPSGDDGGWVVTPDSGAPQLAAPQAPGRGALIVSPAR
jgi:flagellar hook protein FlgE